MANPNPSPKTRFGHKSGNEQGRGPAKGAPNAGRPVKMFSDAMARIAQRGQTLKNVTAILDDPAHPQFMKALEFACDRGFGPQTQKATLDIVIRDESARGEA